MDALHRTRRMAKNMTVAIRPVETVWIPPRAAAALWVVVEDAAADELVALASVEVAIAMVVLDATAEEEVVSVELAFLVPQSDAAFLQASWPSESSG